MQFIQKEGYENAFMWPVVIAGGALRDSWYDKEPVDVDVFIGIYKSTIEKALEHGFFYVNKNYAGEINDISVGVASSGMKFSIDTGEHASGAPGTLFASGRNDIDAPGINVILHEFEEEGEIPDETAKMVEKMFDEFPASISKIAYSPTLEKWYIHPDFEETAETSVIKVKSDITAKYIHKLYPKYTGFKRVFY
jgi:hypothetical protein